MNRLWYQLTITLEAFLAIPSSGAYQQSIYEEFVLDFATKINQLKLVAIGISVARQYQGVFMLLITMHMDLLTGLGRYE